MFHHPNPLMNGAVLSWAVQVMCPITDYDSQSLCGFVKNKIGHTSHIPQGWYFHCNNLWQCSLKQHIVTMIGTSQQLGQSPYFYNIWLWVKTPVQHRYPTIAGLMDGYSPKYGNNRFWAIPISSASGNWPSLSSPKRWTLLQLPSAPKGLRGGCWKAWRWCPTREPTREPAREKFISLSDTCGGLHKWWYPKIDAFQWKIPI